jgi:hypothetical protein
MRAVNWWFGGRLIGLLLSIQASGERMGEVLGKAMG